MSLRKKGGGRRIKVRDTEVRVMQLLAGGPEPRNVDSLQAGNARKYICP